MTNDGELANRILHPRYEVNKTYQAEVRGVPSPAHLKLLEQRYNH
jgi:23S rRNA pseudouridine2605 synthase